MTFAVLQGVTKIRDRRSQFLQLLDRHDDMLAWLDRSICGDSVNVGSLEVFQTVSLGQYLPLATGSFGLTELD